MCTEIQICITAFKTLKKEIDEGVIPGQRSVVHCMTKYDEVNGSFKAFMTKRTRTRGEVIYG